MFSDESVIKQFSDYLHERQDLREEEREEASRVMGSFMEFLSIGFLSAQAPDYVTFYNELFHRDLSAHSRGSHRRSLYLIYDFQRSFQKEQGFDSLEDLGLPDFDERTAGVGDWGEVTVYSGLLQRFSTDDAGSEEDSKVSASGDISSLKIQSSAFLKTQAQVRLHRNRDRERSVTGIDFSHELMRPGDSGVGLHSHSRLSQPREEEVLLDPGLMDMPLRDVGAGIVEEGLSANGGLLEINSSKEVKQQAILQPETCRIDMEEKLKEEREVLRQDNEVDKAGVSKAELLRSSDGAKRVKIIISGVVLLVIVVVIFVLLFR